MANKNSRKIQSFIEINGKRYAMHGGSLAPVHAVPRMGQDVVASVPTTVITPEKAPVQPASSHKPAKVMDIRPLKHVKHHQPQRAQTLVRRSVNKPAPATRLKAVTRTDILAKKASDITVVPKISFHQTNPRLKAKAARINQSELIRRFSPTVFVSEQAEQPSPQERAAVYVSPEAAPQHSMDIFERALAKADAHTEKPVNHKRETRKQAKHAHHAAKKPHHRTSTLVTVSLSVLLLTGFLAYQNKTALTLRYASAKAGFHASLPSYRPAGFSIGRFSYGTGNVSTAFSNDASHQQFTLTQSAKADSQTSLQDVVTTASKNYQAIQHDGKTIYIYGNNSATWLSNGVLYKLDSNANLSTSQIIDLATSI